MANGRLLSTSSAHGMPHSARWSANPCWCSPAGSTGPNTASASKATTPSSRPASARVADLRLRVGREIRKVMVVASVDEWGLPRSVFSRGQPDTKKSRGGLPNRLWVLIIDTKNLF
ncbi:hypothetical protein D3C71_1693660 [compost metagenome]